MPPLLEAALGVSKPSVEIGHLLAEVVLVLLSSAGSRSLQEQIWRDDTDVRSPRAVVSEAQWSLVDHIGGLGYQTGNLCVGEVLAGIEELETSLQGLDHSLAPTVTPLSLDRTMFPCDAGAGSLLPDLSPGEFGSLGPLHGSVEADVSDLRPHVGQDGLRESTESNKVVQLGEESLAAVARTQLNVYSPSVLTCEEERVSLDGGPSLYLVTHGDGSTEVKADVGEGSDAEGVSKLREVAHLLLGGHSSDPLTKVAALDYCLGQAPRSDDPKPVLHCPEDCVSHTKPVVLGVGVHHDELGHSAGVGQYVESLVPQVFLETALSDSAPCHGQTIPPEKKRSRLPDSPVLVVPDDVHVGPELTFLFQGFLEGVGPLDSLFSVVTKL